MIKPYSWFKLSAHENNVIKTTFYFWRLLSKENRTIFSDGFLLAKNQVLRVLIDCNRQLLLIKIYAEISNIFKKVHHLLKLRASNKRI